MFTLPKFKETPHTSTDIPEGVPLPQLKDELLGLVAQEQTHHHRMGQIYNSIVEQKLAQKAGYKTAREFFSKHFADLSQATLSMYGAVADAFTEPVTQRYGVTRLYLLLSYKDAAGIEVDPEQPGDTLIEVPDDKGQLSPRSFTACSVEQMRQALRRKRKPASSKPLPPEAEALTEQYRTAVMAYFPKGKGTHVKVLLRNEKGKAVLDFKGIPVEQIHQLLEVLQSQQPARLRLDAAAEVRSPLVGRCVDHQRAVDVDPDIVIRRGPEGVRREAEGLCHATPGFVAERRAQARASGGELGRRGLACFHLLEHDAIQLQGSHRVHHALGGNDEGGRVSNPEDIQVLWERSGIKPVRIWAGDPGSPTDGARRSATRRPDVGMQLPLSHKL